MNGNDSAITSIGFIGLGEAGRTIAAGLARLSGVAVCGYDTSFQAQSAATEWSVDKVRMVGSPQELADSAQLIFSTVVACAASSAAAAIAPHLRRCHVYFELNTISPKHKLEIAKVIDASGATFVEGAIMTNVITKGHRVPIFACGPGASQLAVFASTVGMDVEDLGPHLGRASATKMFRSIIVKGLEALMLESLSAAERYGVGDDVLAKVAEGYPGLNWRALATELVGRTALHGARRADEMREVASTLEEMGTAPHMAAATAKCIADSARALRGERGHVPDDYRTVIATINNYGQCTAESGGPTEKEGQPKNA